ncbi:hypothetical protein BK654_29755 [Pseudomonas brassicacearum]|nr:hypothetical protein BK654_29755 [Pseudomonas brassicacearum]
MGTTQGDILEFAGELIEVFTVAEASQVEGELAVEELLLVPQLREPPGVTTTEHFHSGGQASCVGLVHAVISDVT